MAKKKPKLYGVCAWHKGTPEDKTRCIESVMDSVSRQFRQCCRKPGYGPGGEYCKQHSKESK